MTIEPSCPPCVIRLLGPFAASLAEGPLPRLRTRKGYWLLALLALRHPRPVERAWLAGTLWPESPDAQALFNLRHCLNDLRRALGAQAFRIRSSSKHALALDLCGAECDVLAFDRAVERGDSAALSEAVSLYRGPLLEGCLEEWVFPERQAREQAYLAALERLADQALQAGEAQAAVGYLQRAVSTDPLRESAQRLLLQASGASGDYAKAAQSYRAFRTLLRRELRAEPSAETTALYHRLREEAAQPAPTGSTGSASAQQRAVPRPLTSLVGRENEIDEITALLTHARLVTLAGSGGVGKTRLAIQVADKLSAGYPHGAWFVDLTALSDPALVEQRVCAALRLREIPGATLLESLIAHLRPRRSLLVLDNCEHLIDACARLAEALLQACPGLTILATSREPLKTPGERFWRVPSLAVPDAALLDRPQKDIASILLEYDAVRLFVERAAQSDPAFALTNDNAPAIARICRRLDGIPLALELAAARTRALAVEQIAARLRDRFDLLTGGARTALPRHRTLRALIDWSFDLLSESERTLLRRLAVFAGEWTLEAAEWICAGSELESDEIVDVVTSLVDKSLVVCQTRGGRARYRLLETTRAYAWEALAGTGEAETWKDRHADYHLRLAEEVAAQAAQSNRSDWLDRPQDVYDEIRAALEWLLDSRGDEPEERGLRLAGALVSFWFLRGHLREGRRWLKRALLGRTARTPARAAALIGLGHLMTSWGDPAERCQYIEEGVAIHEEIGDPGGLARALCSLGFAREAQGDPAGAREALERSLDLFRAAGNDRGVVEALNLVGLLAFNLGDFPFARDCFDQALVIAREARDELASLGPINNLGLVAYAEADYATAYRHHETCLGINQAMENKAGIAWSLTNLGETALGMGELEKAQELQSQSLLRFLDLDHYQGISEAVRGLAHTAAAQREDASQARRAARLFGASERLRETLGAIVPNYNRPEHERGIAAVRERLGEEAFAALWNEGYALTRDQTIDFALDDPTAVIV